jgi:hypothetical protein
VLGIAGNAGKGGIDLGDAPCRRYHHDAFVAAVEHHGRFFLRLGMNLVFGNVGVRAGHHQWPALGIALHHPATRQYPAPATTQAVAAHFHFISRAQAIQMALHAAFHLRQVLGMNMGQPLCRLTSAVWRIAQHGFPAVADLEIVRLDIPVPIALVGAFNHPCQLLLAEQQSLLGRFLFRQVAAKSHVAAILHAHGGELGHHYAAIGALQLPFRANETLVLQGQQVCRQHGQTGWRQQID